MFEKILVAIDGSAHGERALKSAARLAKAHGARLEILHVLGHGKVPEGLARFAEAEHIVERRPSATGEAAHLSAGLATVRAEEDPAYAVRLRLAIGERLVEHAKSAAHDAGVAEVHGEIRDGEPAEVILASATRDGADLIVMGTRGHSELKRLLLGSVSHKVLQLADCPCLTVK